MTWRSRLAACCSGRSSRIGGGQRITVETFPFHSSSPRPSFELPSMRRPVGVKSISCFCWTRVQEGKPTFAQAGHHHRAMWICLRTWYVVGGGEQVTYEEMIQIEEAKVVAEQKAWEPLHEAIFKELFNQTDKQVLAEELAVEQ